MKRKGTAKRKIGARIVLAGFVLLCFCLYRQALALKNGLGNFLKETDVQEVVRNDGQMKQADIAAQCAVWESRHGTEEALPVELFIELQRYVAEGKCADALSDYRQEELICTTEELAEACPDYETFVGKCVADWHGRNFWLTDKIYRLEGEDGTDCFLLFFRYEMETDDTRFLSAMILKQDGEEWQYTSSVSAVSGIWDYEIFAREKAGEKVYYYLSSDDSLAWMNLARLSEPLALHVPQGGWKIRPIETGVKPEIIFQETESALMVRIKEYIEENACFLAWMQQNDKPIWGDEGKEAHYAVRGAIALDANGTEQIWAIDFWEASQKETVTFRMSKMEESSLLLEVFDGGRDGRMLLSCKLIIIQEVGVSEITPVYWETIDCNGVTVRESENLAWNEMWERVLQEQRQRSIASWQGEKDFTDAVFNLMREEAWTGLAGEPNMLLESYRVDLTEGTERFMQMVLEMGEENIFGYPGRKAQECKWAYRWYGEDRGENFLTCINYNYAKDSIQWWKVTEGRLEEYDYVTECINPSQIINCEGRVYCITEAVPYYRGGEVYANILEIGNEESWREAVFSISADSDSVEKQEFTCFALYEEEGLSLGIKDYVQKRYEEMARTCVSGSWNRLLSGTEEGQGLTAEARRILNSLSDGNGNLYANHHYFAADVDNDGMVEYGAADDGSFLDVTFYELEKGTFHSIPLQEMLSEQNNATGLLAKASILRQLWCEKLEDTTYLFTVEEVEYSPDLLLRIRVLKGNYIEDKAVYLLKVSMAEDYREWDLEITPSAEAVG